MTNRHGESEQFLVTYNPGRQIKYTKDLERVYMGKAPTLGTVAKNYGNATAESWVIAQLHDLEEFAGCREKLTVRQLDELSALIISRYGYMKISELMLFFVKFKGCEYGKFYGAIDPILIMEGLKSFSRERIDRISEYEAQRNRAQAEESRLEIDKIRNRYASRIPHAFTDKAPISFTQYLRLGYDSKSDAELKTLIGAYIA